MAAYAAAALVAHVATNSAAPSATPAPAAEKIPPSMAKFVDVEAELPVNAVQLDGLVRELHLGLAMVLDMFLLIRLS